MTNKEYQHALDLKEKDIRTNEKNKTIAICQEVIRKHFRKGTLAHRTAEELFDDLEKLKETEIKNKEVCCTDCKLCSTRKNADGKPILYCSAEHGHHIKKTVFVQCNHFDLK